ncbi:MAG TPA: hypothetical protein PLP14_11035, partial [Chitinophagaceae bacterium]|nr:hypothetical protein [Chitinophagaceae bacterium]
HTDSLYLTVNYNTATATNATACDTYSFGGNTYTQSGTYVVNGSNASGCLQTDTLHLTIKLSTSHSTPITACDGYYWYGNAYNQSGTYTSTSVNPVGCTHTEILNLVIQNSSTVTETVTACGSYTWLVNNTSYTNSGNYSSVNGCITNELQLTIIQTQNYSTTLTADGCYTWPETGTTYINSGTYSYTTLNTSSGCTETHLLNLTIVPGVKVQCRALLAGPYMGSGLMHDSLRVTGLIPLTEPYSSNPFNRPALPNAMVVPNFETASAALFLNSGNDAIVDWVMLELRQASNPSLIVANKRALIQRDGDIVSHVDGQSPVFFPSIAPGMYYLSIKHRNHVGVMTQNTRLFDPCMTQWIDFSNPLEPVYVQNGISNPPRKSAGAWMLLWSGDANFNKNVKYNGLLNDKDAILNNLGGVGNINLTTYGYRPEDLNMDGKIRYNGSDNDRIIILNN